jgi:hypothetical protein
MGERNTPESRGEVDYAWVLVTIALLSLVGIQMFGPWFLLTLAASLGSLVILMILRRMNRSPRRPPDPP